MSHQMNFDMPRRVEIQQGRWDVRIRIQEQSGEWAEFIASADAFYTEHDGIWFGTADEHEEQFREAFHLQANPPPAPR